MAFPCAHCGSVLTQAGLDEYQCLACGRQTKADGSPRTPDPVFAAPATENPDRRYRPGDVVPTVASGATETVDVEVVNPPAVSTPDAPPAPDYGGGI